VTRSRVQAIAEYVIRRACRRLPDEVSADRRREWAAELPAILGDPDSRAAALRQARALRYAAGVYLGARRLSQAAGLPRRAAATPVGWASRSQLVPLRRPRVPPGSIPAAAAVLLAAGAIVLLHAYPPHGTPDYPVLAASLAAEALGIAAIVRFVRWIRRKKRETPHR